jgi:hypothetical protein
MQKQNVNDVKTIVNSLKNNIEKSRSIHASLHQKKKGEDVVLKKLNKQHKIYLITTINIKIKQNNIFCTLRKNQKIKKIASAGLYKIRISKKFLKLNYKKVIKLFLKKIKKKITFNNLLLNISCSKKFRKKILRQVLKFRKKYYKQFSYKYKKKNYAELFAISFKNKKCFNGCRPKKKIRKKRRRFRVFNKKLRIKRR